MRSASRGVALRRWAARVGPAPLLRLGMFTAVVCVSGTALVLHSARAEFTEALWGAGARIMAFPGAPHEGVRQLRLNGVRLSFRTQTVESSLGEVLDHYEAICGTSIATQAARNDQAGYVACLDVGDAAQDLGALANRFVRFSETGDLRDLGAPRYVFARRVESRLGGHVLLLTMWADSAFNLYRMLPRRGADAAGRDLAGVPRPAGSQRILSAWEEQEPSGVLVYRVAAKSARELEQFYRAELPSAGWRFIERNRSESVRVDGTYLLFAEKGDRLVTVLCRSVGASQSVLTILASEPS